MDILKKSLQETCGKIGSMAILIAVRQGLTYMIPFLLIGSMALVFLSLPIPAYQAMMNDIFGGQWQSVFFYIRDSTFNIMSLIMVVCISYSYASEIRERQKNINPIITAVVSLSSFVAISGISKENFTIANFGVVGAFIAIFVAIISSMIFVKLSSIDFLKIKTSSGANSTFQDAVVSIYPAAITILLFALFNQLLMVIFGVADIQYFISSSLCSIFLKIHSPFLSALLFILLIHLLWFFGMHGSNILEPVAQSIFVPALSANQLAVSLGQPPTLIFTKTFFDTFVLMGGCGATWCLICAILFFGKYKNQRRLVKLSVIPVVFNINELIVFGIPIVLNPIFIIPFLAVPLVLTVSTFLAMNFGLVPYTTTNVAWTTPVFLSGYLATHSINGGVLQLFNLGIGILCYAPFVKLSEKISDEKIQDNLTKLYNQFRDYEKRGVASTLLSRSDELGNLARALCADLENDLKAKKLKVFYQPQVDYEKQVVGVEALLRWNHDSYGYIYPPLIIALAEEADFIDRLGYWVLDLACADRAKMYNSRYDDLAVSVNISVFQLENDLFIEQLAEIIHRHKIDPHTLTLEVTEQIALTSNNLIFERIKRIRSMGVKFAMDDFGMGHSSLMYLKEYHFDIVKLDGSLVREIIASKSCRDIIASIVQLGKALKYSVVAEYVEYEEQRFALHELGCDKYQGYLYGKAVPYDELVETYDCLEQKKELAG